METRTFSEGSKSSSSYVELLMSRTELYSGVLMPKTLGKFTYCTVENLT